MIDLRMAIMCDSKCSTEDEWSCWLIDETWENAVYESAKQAGWQCTGSDYCPNHWHVTCVECRDWQVGPRRRLEYDGWTRLRNDSEDALCPKCSKQKKGTGR